MCGGGAGTTIVYGRPTGSSRLWNPQGRTIASAVLMSVGRDWADSCALIGGPTGIKWFELSRTCWDVEFGDG